MSTNLYDDLDHLYRAIWGTSLHHGLWITGKESSSQAQKNLTSAIFTLLKPEGTIADVGCGYGMLSQQLIEQFDCHVIANTNSQNQAQLIPTHSSLTLLEGDWMTQNLTPLSLDRVLALESLSHFSSFEHFLSHTVPAMKPGSRLVIADWFSETGTRPLLRHLASSGQLPPWRAPDSLQKAAQLHGLKLTHSQNFSHQVAPTWSHLFRKALLLPLRQPRLIPRLLGQTLKHPALLWTFPLLRLAYQTGDLQYHLLSFEK